MAVRAIPESFKPLVTAFENAGGIVKSDVDEWVFVTKNNDEIARIAKKEGQDIFEIDDEYFTEAGDVIQQIQVTTKADCGDVIRNPALVSVDGELRFIEDVTSYGTAKIQQTIKQRY